MRREAELKLKKRAVEEMRFEVEGSCKLYVEIYVNHMVEATAKVREKWVLICHAFLQRASRNRSSAPLCTWSSSVSEPQDPELKPVARG